jgi:pimeloyl-ACP methyl ester carboxylesterase
VSEAPARNQLLEPATSYRLEFDLADVRCPVRAIHGTIDDLEPYANLERLAAQLADCAVVALPGMGHFGPWLWPDSIMGLVSGD